MIADRHQHYDHVVLRMVLALVLLLAFASSAHGTSSSNSSSSSGSGSWQLWRRRSLLSEATADEDDSSSPTTTIRLVAVLAPPVTANAAAGSNLHASDQCGGAGGLCNQTTIGIPCGDHMWQSVYCPQNFTCARKNASYWQCTLIPGRTAPRDSTFNSSERYVPVAELLPASMPQSQGELNSGKPGDTSASSSSSSSSSQGGVAQHSDETIVPVCGPDTLRGHNRMCNRPNQFILPLDQVDPAAAGAAATSAAGSSRANACNGPAAQMLRPGALLLAAAAGAAVLGI